MSANFAPQKVCILNENLSYYLNTSALRLLINKEKEECFEFLIGLLRFVDIHLLERFSYIYRGNNTNIPIELRNLKDINKFKQNLKQLLLSTLLYSLNALVMVIKISFYLTNYLNSIFDVLSYIYLDTIYHYPILCMETQFLYKLYVTN